MRGGQDRQADLAGGPAEATSARIDILMRNQDALMHANHHQNR